MSGQRPIVATTNIPPSLGQRLFLYGTAACTGAAVMVIEILGAKMLAPYVGTSHFVWTAQIVVTLLALATGYYVGGRWVDRSPRTSSLYWAILAAGIYLSLAVTQVERIAYACLNFKLALGSLLASSALFFVPLALLAVTGPFLVRTLTLALGKLGGSMGRLTAVSTMGSVVGTVLVGYVLVPLLPNSLTMLIVAGALMMLSVVYLALWRIGGVANYAAALALIVPLVCGVQIQSKGLLVTPSFRGLFQVNSNFGQLQVFESRQKPYRYLLNDNLHQGAYDTSLRKGLGSWSDVLFELARAYTTDVHDALVIGLGVGLVPMQLAKQGARVDVVEINPTVVELAQRFFGLEPEKLNIILGDGRQFINANRKKYDVVVLDAFLGEAAPAHLMTKEAFTSIKNLLNPNGVLVINCHGSLAPGRDFLIASLHRTLLAAFTNVQVRSGQDLGKVLNVFFVASPAQLTLRRVPDFSDVHPDNRQLAEATFSRVVEPRNGDGVIVTDDFNPVDYYEAENREESRRTMVTTMQTVEKEGAGL